MLANPVCYQKIPIRASFGYLLLSLRPWSTHARMSHTTSFWQMAFGKCFNIKLAAILLEGIFERAVCRYVLPALWLQHCLSFKCRQMNDDIPPHPFVIWSRSALCAIAFPLSVWQQSMGALPCTMTSICMPEDDQRSRSSAEFMPAGVVNTQLPRLWQGVWSSSWFRTATVCQLLDHMTFNSGCFIFVLRRSDGQPIEPKTLMMERRELMFIVVWGGKDFLETHQALRDELSSGVEEEAAEQKITKRRFITSSIHMGRCPPISGKRGATPFCFKLKRGWPSWRRQWRIRKCKNTSHIYFGSYRNHTTVCMQTDDAHHICCGSYKHHLIVCMHNDGIHHIPHCTQCMLPIASHGKHLQMCSTQQVVYWLLCHSNPMISIWLTGQAERDLATCRSCLPQTVRAQRPSKISTWTRSLGPSNGPIIGKRRKAASPHLRQKPVSLNRKSSRLCNTPHELSWLASTQCLFHFKLCSFPTNNMLRIVQHCWMAISMLYEWSVCGALRRRMMTTRSRRTELRHFQSTCQSIMFDVFFHASFPSARCMLRLCLGFEKMHVQSLNVCRMGMCELNSALCE